jgi:hypothetical protein
MTFSTYFSFTGKKSFSENFEKKLPLVFRHQFCSSLSCSPLLFFLSGRLSREFLGG